MNEAISSPRNPIVRLVQRAREGREDGLLVAEGVRLIEEALDAGLSVETALVSPKCSQTERGAALAERLSRAAHELKDCSDEVLQKASALTTPQGCIAICARPEFDEDDFFRGEAPFVVIAAGVRDPGNLGSLVRTAEAAGASGLYALASTADPYKDKALRGSAGSVFRLPCRAAVSADELVELVERRGLTLIATDSQRGEDLWDCDFGPSPQAFVLGAEAGGVPKRIVERCDRFLRVPMQAPVESLNVAVAAGAVLFEQRRRLSGGGRS